MSIEIERKYLLKALPDDLCCGELINQGYVSVGDPEVRVRKKGKEYFITKKSGKGFIRTEEEVLINEAFFKDLWSLTAGKRIEKTRYTMVGSDGLVWEIDEYHGVLAGLFIAELELKNKDDEFKIPQAIQAVMTVDVTEDERYKNKNLAVDGLP